VTTSGRSSWMERPLVRAGAILIILALAFHPWLPFPWRLPTVGLLACLFVRYQTGGFAAVGLQWPRPLRSTLVWAVTVAVAGIVVAEVMVHVLQWLTGIDQDLSGYGALKGNLALTLQLLAGALLSAAIGEELIFRGFLLPQLLALTSILRAGPWPALLVGAVLFAIPHAAQGPVGLFVTGTMGLLLGWAFLRSGWNLYAMILAHALIDIVGLGRLYLGWI
jgi:uncharacterized protein